jgi:pimeloyl-ACP methyl ester carboxylesterase
MIVLYYVLLFILLLIIIFHLLDKNRRREITEQYKYIEDENGNIIDVEGIKVYYIERGGGFPLVIIHGFMSTCADFDYVIKELSKHYKVIAVDLIGFGRSDTRANLDFSKKNMAEIVNKLMINKGHSKYGIIGHSMGGGVALNMAHYFAESVCSLVLVDSVGYKDSKRIPVPPILIEFVFKAYYVQKLFYQYCFYDKRKVQGERFDKIYYLNSLIPGDTIYAFSRMDDSNTIEGNLSGIKCPTLIIWGKHDKITPLRSAYNFKEDIKGSSLVIFENSGHIPYTEEEKKFINELFNFLRENI